MIRFDQVAPEVMQAMCTPMHQVLSPAPVAGHHPPTGALYIGSFIAAQDRDMLREHNITHLVQVLNVPWLPAYDKEGFSTYHISIDDATSVDIRPFLEAACNYIDAAICSGGNCLVHCQQGVSRSAAVVLAYLIRDRNMTLDNAIVYLRRKRACVKPNSSFIQALQDWEAATGRPGLPRRFTA